MVGRFNALAKQAWAQPEAQIQRSTSAYMNGIDIHRRDNIEIIFWIFLDLSRGKPYS